MAEALELTIARLGHKGDGIAEVDGAPIYVPFSLPGEHVRVDGDRGELLEIIAPSDDRVPPQCQHFGRCGGCALQHLEFQSYLDWQRQQVVAALHARHIESDVLPVFSVGPGQRRRAVFGAIKRSQGVALGFYECHSNKLIDVRNCPVVVSDIEKALPLLRELADDVLPPLESARFTVVACDNGLDVAVECDGLAAGQQFDPAIARLAARTNIVRLTVNGDQIYGDGAPVLTIDSVKVVPPPGGFVQAARVAQEHMTGLLLAVLPKTTKRVADLFCGLGSFALPVARRAQVLAIDSDPRLIEALQQACQTAQGLKRVETKVRDLMQTPLSRTELKDIDAVIFDPPRAGARWQAEALAKSKVPLVIPVSCNVATFARDARILLDGGYSLQSVLPIDQFVFSPHVEIFAVFRR